MICETPASNDVLFAYWLHELPEVEEHALEEHLFTCDHCTEASRTVSELVSAIASRVPPAVTASAIARLERRGLRLLQTRIAANTRATVLFGNDVDLLVHRLAGNFAGVGRLDCEVVNAADNSPIITFADVAFDRDGGDVNLVCQRHYAENFPPDIKIKLIAVRPTGREVIAQFGVVHIVEART